jgi:hypothetical protein
LGVVTRPCDPDAVSPIELFFDLVFVFAVSQLSEHLRAHLTWRGAAESAVMLIAVSGSRTGSSKRRRSISSPSPRRGGG